MNRKDPVAVVYIGETGPTTLGPIWVAATEQGLVALEIGADRAEIIHLLEHLGFEQIVVAPERLTIFSQQVCDYLAGRVRDFTFPIDWSVLKPFQAEALKATFAIPYGETRTYADIARSIGRPLAARAVGRAEATNPMPLVIPCHRVLGTDGKLHGYGAAEGLATKAWLLQLERGELAAG